MAVEEVVAASKARIEELLAPVNGGVGEDISYDEKFEEIKGEADKLQSLTGETVNWGNISALSEELLTEKSKDFRLACYWAAAKAQDNTLDALLDSMVLISEYTKQYWDEGYPPLRRIRARAGMLGWWSDRTAGARDIKLTGKDQEKVQAFDELSKALDADFREKMADNFPGVTELREAARHLLRTCPKEKPPPPKPEPVKPAAAEAAPAQAAAAAPAPPPPAPVAAAAAPAGEGPAANAGAIVDPDTARRAVGPAGLLLAKMGMMIRTGKPEDPMAYQLRRMGMWLELTTAPPVTDGKTLVPPPPDNLRTRFDGLVSASDWLTLLNEADNAAGDFILWLDPHRYVATAMDRLGALFIKAKEALLLQVALVLKRVPTLPDLAFNTGTPFADGQTKMWIEAEVLPVLASGEGGGGGGAAEPSVLDEPLKEAKDLAVKGKLPEAIAVVSKAAATAPTPTDRFRGRLALAQLCLQAAQYDVARAQLDALEEVVRRHELTGWQPQLCAEVYAAQYSAYKGLCAETKPPAGQPPAPVVPGQPVAPTGPPPELVAAQQHAFEQLCQLDPALALKLSGD